MKYRLWYGVNIVNVIWFSISVMIVEIKCVKYVKICIKNICIFLIILLLYILIVKWLKNVVEIIFFSFIYRDVKNVVF